MYSIKGQRTTDDTVKNEKNLHFIMHIICVYVGGPQWTEPLKPINMQKEYGFSSFK